MANPAKGEADIKLADGRQIKLVFDANAWCEIEDALGRTTQDIVADLKPRMADDGKTVLEPPKAGLKVQRAIIWGGLRRYHPEFTIEQAGDILVEAAEGMAKAIGGGMPQAEGEEAGEDAEPHPPKPSRGTGTKP